MLINVEIYEGFYLSAWVEGNYVEATRYSTAEGPDIFYHEITDDDCVDVGIASMPQVLLEDGYDVGDIADMVIEAAQEALRRYDYNQIQPRECDRFVKYDSIVWPGWREQMIEQMATARKN